MRDQKLYKRYIVIYFVLFIFQQVKLFAYICHTIGFFF